MAYGRWGSAVSLVLVLGGVGVVAPACATGEEERDPPGASSNVNSGDDAGPSTQVPQCVPTGPEVCDGKDNNCDGRIDEGFDADGDGWVSCAVNGKKADCDDKDPKVNPGAPEVCNNIDDNCDGTTDEGFDKDGDGFYACVRGTTAADCDDSDPKVKPGGAEVCNGKDDDCNGKVDDIPADIDSTKTTGNASLAVPPSTNWKLAGAAQFGSSLVPSFPGYVRLNPEANSQGGAVWWGGQYTFDTFDMTATVTIQDKPGADGMTFAWVVGNDYTQLGYPGAGYGVVGVPGGGYAVAIDTYSNGGTELAAPYLAILNASTGAQIATSPLPATIRDNNGHELRVKLEAGKVSVWVDTINRINDIALPGYVPFKGRWGFTGATGGLNEIHWVSNIRMKFPNGQGCVIP
ncbi:MAG: hypothetical protein JST00_02725 [Deltaproteobacteria bacterium]|nr:hypothetical protein [Deltaproteobacteria bacterium]